VSRFFAGGETAKLESWLQENGQAGAYDSWQATTVPVLSALAGSGSSRATKFIGEIQKNLPQKTDTLATAKAKIATLNTLFDNAANTILGKQASGTSSGSSASGGDRVSVVSPDGKVGTIPKEQLSDAIKSGYKQQ
jgi:hypothetical protein